MLAAATGVVMMASPQVGLALGLFLGLAGLAPWPMHAKVASRWLIQACVVLLGLRMDLHHVLDAGLSGLLMAAGTILGTFVLGEILRRGLVVPGRISTLICSGTAICGGSAIAAVGAAIRASAAELAVATGTIFILNGIALYLFPWMGRLLALDAWQFGTWAGVAIHDVSSVVGASRAYAGTSPDHSAEATAVVVKLSRVLWIVPIASIAAVIASRRTPPPTPEAPADASISAPAAPRHERPPMMPWYIALFLLASLLRTLVPTIADAEPIVRQTTAIGMSLALYLIGCGLTRAALASVGWRPMLQAAILWIAIALMALLVVRPAW
jgi:uncharacterized membrane protein YadS